MVERQSVISRSVRVGWNRSAEATSLDESIAIVKITPMPMLTFTPADLRLMARNTAKLIRMGGRIPLVDRRGNPFAQFDDQSRTAQLEQSRTDYSSRIPTLMPPIGAGHDEEGNVLGRSDLPKQGEVISLYLDGNIIKADFGMVPDYIIEQVKKGLYSKVSCELWEKPPGKFAGKGWMLKRVALLGADVPAIYTLEDIPIPEEFGTIRGVEIFEVGDHNNIKYTLDDLRDVVRNYWLNRPADQVIKERLRRYLNIDAGKTLGDGASLFNDKSTPVVRIFRSLNPILTVDATIEEKSMTADQIRAALVSAGLFEQDEVNGMSEGALMKLAKLCGLDQAKQPPPEAANADEKPAEGAGQQKPAAAAANADDCTPGQKPAMNADAGKMQQFSDAMFNLKLTKALSAALAPYEAKLNALTAQASAAQKSQVQQAAVMFADKLRTNKKITAGMRQPLIDLYEFVSTQPGEVHFNDGGKTKKGSPGDLLQRFLDSMPNIEEWAEMHGGPLGDPNTKLEQDKEKLKAAYNKFNDSFKRTMTLDKFIGTFTKGCELYPDYTVEKHLSGF